MITKLTALALSGIMTVGLVAAAAPSVEPVKSDLATKMEGMVGDCQEAYFAFKYSNDKGKKLDEKVELYTDPLDKLLLIAVCRGYGEGFQQGQRMS